MQQKKRRDQNQQHRKSGPTVPPPAAGAPSRTILLHYHIFKNGGSTLDAALRKNLGTAWREIEGDDPNGPMNWSLAIALLKNYPEIKALSSHTARIPPPASPGYNFIPLFLIRHPLDRILSVYHHEKRNLNRHVHPALEIARTASLLDFIQLAMGKIPAVVCNAQTSSLARGGVYFFPPVAADLVKAKAAVAQSIVPGVLERMDEYLTLLERELTGLVPNLDLACHDENRNPTRRPTLLARLREIRTSLPPTLWRELRERNRLDLELWRFTYRLARTKFSQMPDATKRLASFRQRKLRGSPPADLPWTGERLVASATGDFVAEHLHRYALALEFAKNCDVLDVACGEGYGSALLTKVARSVIGVDCDAPTIAHAWAKYRAKNLQFAEGRVEKLPLPASSVDLVVSYETLEHLEDHDAMMKEIKRVLRPGGRLLISTPNSKPYRKVSGKLNPFHLRELDLPGFTKLLSKHFKHVNVSCQRSVTGSWISPLDARAVPTTEYSGNFEQLNELKSDTDTPYLIAIASDLAVPALPTSLFNSKAELLTQIQGLMEERERERKSFASLTTDFGERTTWAKSLENDLRTAQERFDKLTKEYAERTTWALSLEDELRRSHATVDKLTKEYAERTSWALSLEDELKKSRAAAATQAQLLKERTTWAKSLEHELLTAQGNYAKLAKEHDERTSWALSLGSELQRARDACQEQAQAATELSQERDRLNTEIADLSCLSAKLNLELTGLRAACAELVPLIPADPGKGEHALLEQCMIALANLRRDLASKNAELHAAMANGVETQLRADVTESEVVRLNIALKDAQLHLDGLLKHTADLQQWTNTLAAAKQDIEHQFTSTIAELQAARLELSRYESRLICRLAARAPAAKSVASPRS